MFVTLSLYNLYIDSSIMDQNFLTNGFGERP